MATPSPGTILAIAATAAVVGYQFFKPKPTPRRKKRAQCDTSPFSYNVQTVKGQTDTYLDQGKRNVEEIAVDVSTDLFGTYPGDNSAVTYPPVINQSAGLPRRGVACVFERVTADVLARMNERGMTPGPGQIPPVVFEQGTWDTLGQAASYPWEAAIIETNNSPTPGMFFIVGKPTSFPGGQTNINTDSELVRNALGSAMAMAGDYRKEWVTPPPSGAGQSHPYFNSDAQRLRGQMRDLIQCSPWNDQAYGTTDKSKGGNAPLGPQGRGLNWLPNHADNIGRLASGQSAVRTTDLAGNKLSSPPLGASASSHMQLWIPPVDLSRLAANVPDSAKVITTGTLTWSDGSSVIMPPPSVQAHGVVSSVGAHNGWGCPGI